MQTTASVIWEYRAKCRRREAKRHLTMAAWIRRNYPGEVLWRRAELEAAREALLEARLMIEWSIEANRPARRLVLV